jgi:small-conductance mechanosensitive channel
MWIRKFSPYVWAVCLLAGLVSTGRAETQRLATDAAVQALPASLDTEDIAKRKQAIQARIDALAKPKGQIPDKKDRQEVLADTLQALTGIEEVSQRRADFEAKLNDLPKRLQEVADETDKLAKGPPGKLPKATEELRDEYRGKVEAATTRLQDLRNEVAQGEVRLASIPKELDRLGDERNQLDQARQALGADVATADPDSLPRMRADLLALQSQLDQDKIAALQAERAWLTKRAPLMDAMLGLAQLRIQTSSAALETIRRDLGEEIKTEQASLHQTAQDIAKKQEQPQGPAQKQVSEIKLSVVEIRRTTADYRSRVNALGERIQGQERRNAMARQLVDRLRALVEKYETGDVPAHGVFVLFDRLQHERDQAAATSLKSLQDELQQRNIALFDLDDRLYDFDDHQDALLARFEKGLAASATKDIDAALTSVRKSLDEQRSALRDQQQALTLLVKDIQKFLDLHQELRRQLDDGYFYALNNIFWLRDTQPLSWPVIKEMLRATRDASLQLMALLIAAGQELHKRISTSPELWLPAVLVVLTLPLLMLRLNRWLKSLVDSAIVAHAGGKAPGLATMAAGLVRSALLPGYLALIAWLIGYVWSLSVERPELGLALVHGVLMGVLFLWAGVVGLIAFREQGWGQHFWGTASELNRYLRRVLLVLTAAALLFLVPREVVLLAKATKAEYAAMQALARLLFLAFQATLLVLVLVVGRRGSLLMQTLLATARERNSWLWRSWPLVQATVAAAVLAYIVLDASGYSYAAGFLWSKVIQSLLVLMVLRLLVMVSLHRGLKRLIEKAFSLSVAGVSQAREEMAERTLHVAKLFVDLILVLVAAGIVLRIWGASVMSLLTSPLASLVLLKALLIALALAATILVVQLSRHLTQHALREKTTRSGLKRLPGRKMQTLMPLLHTIVRVTAVFLAVLVTLQVLGVAIGPILAGVGIFGLAVGFAAQSLIKDFINGLFILFEGSLAVGDVVEVRGIGGQVERFTLRAVTLRDLSGNVHVIPNSGIDMVTNMTKGYSRYLLDVGVAYREDVDEVIAVLREIDEEMRRDPLYAYDILEPIEILGLDRFEDSAVVVRARLKTRPIEQWRIGREFNRRMKKVFDQRGIEIPFPHRTVYWGESKRGQMPLEVKLRQTREGGTERESDGVVLVSSS